MSVHNEVRVFVRTRPTAQFAQDLIQYLPDQQVRKNKQEVDFFSFISFGIISFQHIGLL